MKKCKCIQNRESDEGSGNFLVNNFYYYDYVPNAGDHPPFYRVFNKENNSHEDIEYDEFHLFFKKY
ncbi:MAG: hypothetical protein Q8907_05645 [Bacteroidota bacterium]|nr:hypothetical protein [Bacteroidota bacterium]MDP4225038.1 hypothetical protein [Bacteroidota bacterium]MDP4273749.1 hypothetical protein [Bacteroidota bacterium]